VLGVILAKYVTLIGSSQLPFSVTYFARMTPSTIASERDILCKDDAKHSTLDSAQKLCAEYTSGTPSLENMQPD
jgi:hypothetical protein